MTRSADRLFGFFLLGLAAVFGGVGWGIVAPFSYDPLGPRPYPLLLAAVLAVMAVWMLLKPQAVKLPGGRMLAQVGLLIATLVFYQLSFRWLGFILSTSITVVLVARLFKGSWLQGLLTGVGMALVCYGLFNYVLEIPLPAGALFAGKGG
jgi:putative tricarboxylic transport membrane protein